MILPFLIKLLLTASITLVETTESKNVEFIVFKLFKFLCLELFKKYLILFIPYPSKKYLFAPINAKSKFIREVQSMIQEFCK